MNLVYVFSGGPFGIIVIILTYLTAAPLIDVDESFDDDFIEDVNPDTIPDYPVTGLSTDSSGGKFKASSDGAIGSNEGSTNSEGSDTGSSGSSSGFGFATSSGSSGGSGSGGGSGSSGGSGSGGGSGSSRSYGSGGGGSSSASGSSSSGGGGSSSESGSGAGSDSSSGSDEVPQKNPSLEDASTSQKLVGGYSLQLDRDALLIAGVHTNFAWLIPVLFVAGIGLVLVKRR